MNRLLGASLLCLLVAWLSPLHIPPWVAAHSDFMAAIAAILLGAAGLAATAPRVAMPPAAIAVMLLACVPLVQLAAGQIRFAGDAWIAALYLGCAAGAVLWSARVAQAAPAPWARMLATALLAGALASATLILLQRLDVSAGALRLYVVDVRPGYPPGANLAQPNQATTLLGLGLVGLMYLFEQRRVGAAWALGGALLLTGAMAATESRTGLLLFIAVFLGLANLRRRMALCTRPVVLLALAGTWLAAFAAWGRLADALQLEPQLVTLESRAKAGPRTVIWEQLWTAVQARPWSGYGWNQVGTAQMAVADRFADSRHVEHSHNLLLDLLVWNGVPLTLVIVGAALYWLWRTWPRMRTASGAFGLLLMLVLLTHSMVEFPLDYLYFLVPFSMALGLVVADAGQLGRLSLPRSAGVVAVATSAALTAWAIGDYMQVESAFRDMRFAVARIGGPMPERPPPMLPTQFTQLAALHRAWLSLPRDHMTPDEVRFSADVSARFGFAPLLYRHAVVQALNDDVPGARVTLSRLAGLHHARAHAAAIAELRELAATTRPELAALLTP